MGGASGLCKNTENTTKEAGVKVPENVFSVLGKHGQSDGATGMLYPPQHAGLLIQPI